MTTAAGERAPADLVKTGEGRPPLAINHITQDDLSDALSKGWADFKAAPLYAPRRRLDETRAARNPVLRWTPPKPVAEAAE